MVERMPLILQTHPDVWAIVPDPVRLKTPVARPVIHVGQLRAVQRAAYFRRRRGGACSFWMARDTCAGTWLISF